MLDGHSDLTVNIAPSHQGAPRERPVPGRAEAHRSEPELLRQPPRVPRGATLLLQDVPGTPRAGHGQSADRGNDHRGSGGGWRRRRNCKFQLLSSASSSLSASNADATAIAAKSGGGVAAAAMLLNSAGPASAAATTTNQSSRAFETGAVYTFGSMQGLERARGLLFVRSRFGYAPPSRPAAALLCSNGSSSSTPRARREASSAVASANSEAAAALAPTAGGGGGGGEDQKRGKTRRGQRPGVRPWSRRRLRHTLLEGASRSTSPPRPPAPRRWRTCAR